MPLPAGFEEVEDIKLTSNIPEGFEEVIGSPIDITQAAQSALPDSQVQKTLIDVGRGMVNVSDSVTQINKESQIKAMQNRVEGKPSLDKKTGMVRIFTQPEREEAAKELKDLSDEYNTWRQGKDNQLAMYRAGTEGRKWSAMAGEMVGGAAFMPVGGMQGKAGLVGWQLAKEVGKRLGSEAAIGTGAGALDYVPDGMSRADNMLFGAVIGMGLRGSVDGTVGFFKKYFGDAKPTREEAESLLAHVKESAPEITESLDVLDNLVDEKFIEKHLADVPEKEKAGMSQAIKERLAVFNFMNTEPTFGQIMRDPMAMADEIKLSNTPLGEDINKRFAQQREAAAIKMKEVTGLNALARFGKDTIETFETIKNDWLENNNTLYKEATDNADPKLRFELNSLTSAISDNQEKINVSPNAMAALKEVNRKIENKLALPEQIAKIDKQMKTDFGSDTAVGQAYKLMELQKLGGGINAQETNELVVKTLNGYKGLTGQEKELFATMKESVLNDTIAGTGSDSFVKARANFSEMQNLIKNFPVMERLGFYKSGKQPKAIISDEKVFNDLILKSNNRDFNEFLDLLETPRYEQQLAPLKESLREEAFAHINKNAMKGNLDKNNNPTFTKHGFEKALNSFGGMERMRRIFTDEEIMALGVIKRYGDLLTEPPAKKSAVNPSGTAAQTLSNAFGVFSNSPAGKTFLNAMTGAGDLLASMTGANKAPIRKALAGNEVPFRIAQAQEMVNPPQLSQKDQWIMDAMNAGKDVTGLSRPTVSITKGVQSTREDNEMDRKRRLLKEQLMR